MGINSSRQARSGCKYSRHAEVDAITRLPPPEDRGKRKNSKYRKVVDILVIRVTRSGMIRRSDPCFMCIKHMHNIKSYRIRNVYFSNEIGEIEKHTLEELTAVPDDEKHVSCRFKKYSVDQDPSRTTGHAFGAPSSAPASPPKKPKKPKLHKSKGKSKLRRRSKSSSG